MKVEDVRLINLTIQFKKGQFTSDTALGEMLEKLVALIYDNTNAEACLTEIPDAGCGCCQTPEERFSKH